MDEITIHLKPIEAYFNNLTIKDNVQEHLNEIAKVVADNYTFSTLTVRNDPDYRTSLVCTLVQQFFLQAIKSDYQFEKFVYDDKFSHHYEMDEPTHKYITQNIKPLSVLQQTTGEAVYPSTYCDSSNIKALHAYPIFAGAPKGTFKYKFTIEQLKQKYPQFVDFISAKDIKGSNLIGVAV